MMLFHHDIVPFCANARENNPRRDIAGQELFVCAPERNTVRVLHCKLDLKSILMNISYNTYRSIQLCKLICEPLLGQHPEEWTNDERNEWKRPYEASTFRD